MEESYKDKLIAKYQPQLKSFILKRVNNKEDAEDILQDVLYQFLKTINQASSPIEQISAWLFRVARNDIINHGIKHREEELPSIQDEDGTDEILEDFSDTLFNEDGASSPEDEYLRSLIWSELDHALSELPPEQREIYELTEVEGIPMKEIAQTINVPINTLLSRKHYAVLHLRKRLKNLYDEITGHP